MAPFPTPKNLPTGGERSFNVSNLPEKLLRHITCFPPRARWQNACWVWTGYIKPARERYKPARPSENPQSWRASGYFETDKPTPMVRDPYGSSTDKLPAHRVIYGVLTCTLVDDVPVLQRCSDPRCVSPYHVREIAPARGPRIPPAFSDLELSEAQPPTLSEEVWTDEMVFAKLKEIDVYPDIEVASQESGIPIQQIRPGVMQLYYDYYMEHPGDD